jgi:EAL domain-containing protein (putative c-di-GMP-specific phosphodiesterase class I)
MAAQLRDRFEMTAALRAAVAAQRIEVYFQPKIDGHGDILGFEALARWHRPGFAPVPPDQFINIAEDTGLIVELGRQVLERACTEARAWHQATGRPLTVAVNLSPRQLGRTLWEQVDDILTRTELPAQLLELEVTENLLMRDTQWAVDILGRLRERGIRIAVDDFGTGYSSLSYLRTLPIDTLKIDRSFVSDCEQEGSAMAIPHAVIFLGKSLRLKVVAEGVERASQFDVLRRCGCDEFQGYWISRPMDAAQTRAFIDAGFRSEDWPGDWGRLPEMT